MGIIACLMFGILAAWITRSVLVNAGAGGVKAVLVIGLLGGIAGLTGVLFGFGDTQHFNLYNVFLSIVISALFSIAWAKMQPGALKSQPSEA